MGTRQHLAGGSGVYPSGCLLPRAPTNSDKQGLGGGELESPLPRVRSTGRGAGPGWMEAAEAPASQPPAPRAAWHNGHQRGDSDALP